MQKLCEFEALYRPEIQCKCHKALWRHYDINGFINKKTVKSKNRYLFAHQDPKGLRNTCE